MTHRLRQAARVLLQLQESPHRTAVAFSAGVWIAFFPIVGLHTIIALTLAFFFRLNRVAILLGAFINNPWTLAPMFMAGTAFGCLLLGVSPGALANIDWSCGEGRFYTDLWASLRPFVLPYLLGNVALGTISSVASYGLVRGILERRGLARTPPSSATP